MAYALAGAFNMPSDLRGLSAVKLKYNQGCQIRGTTR
ncbi:MAG: hypothetical protein V7640_2091 [Betaproteobacteria bacterium]|jgi:hypothetical protein